MASQQEDDINAASIKPVSSLRSLFEGKGDAKAPPPPKPRALIARNVIIPAISGGHQHVPDITSQPSPKDIEHGHIAHSDIVHHKTSSPESKLGLSKVIKLPEMSMSNHLPVPVRPPPRSASRTPPLVTIVAPNSPPRHAEHGTITGISGYNSRDSSRAPTSSMTHVSATPSNAPALPSRTASPYSDTAPSHVVASAPTLGGNADPAKPARVGHHPLLPPPINRAAKPNALGVQPPSTPPDRKTNLKLMPNQNLTSEEDRISPFSTPPSESESPPALSPHTAVDAFPASRSQPRYRKRVADCQFHSPFSVQDSSPEMIRPGEMLRPVIPSTTEHVADRTHSIAEPHLQRRPSLPARRGFSLTSVQQVPAKQRNLSPRPPPPEPPVRKSMDVPSSLRSVVDGSHSRASVDIPSSSHTPVSNTNNKLVPLPRRAEPRGRSTKADDQPSRLIPARVSSDFRRDLIPATRTGSIPRHSDVADSGEDDSQSMDTGLGTSTDYPDPSNSNRRPPKFLRRPYHLETKYETRLLAVCGEYVCTAGFLTRVWSLVSGDLLISLTHGDTHKATAVTFKPSRQVTEEGRRLWLGMNSGELNEIDIASQSVVDTKSGYHRAPVIKILRNKSDMWTIDEEGKWLIWPADSDGNSSLDVTPFNCRIPRGASFILKASNQLWLAYGKDLTVYEHRKSSRTANQLTTHPLSQTGVGEVTSGAVMNIWPDRVYFGHIDGKVSIYSSKDFSCLGIINVSLYKISSLVGVGDFLWASFNTGKVYVYDTGTQPWTVKKDWRAHQNTISSVVIDRSSIWKLNRLQVLSLGTDNCIRIWDGMLQEDWLDLKMQALDTEFCSFQEITALVTTWNAGASKPTSLRQTQQDDNFFRELLTSRKVPPDILVFGFQELVDLEDKKVTARSLFRSSRKKDHVDNEHLSHQYRAWKDHLIRVIDEILPRNESYTLLHTANLIGLFTCVFVKSSLRPRVHGVDAAQVKLGMGGLHGNKGALIVRFMVDDSSLCFINCHLAAGQKHTVHRNNDVAAIMEFEGLPPQYDSTARTDVFVGGGDGSMILDHEICVLNGDLNYRIDAIPRDTVVAAVKEGNLAKLLDRDQLLVSRRRNPGFRLRAFNENPITFAPTYKYDVGTDKYDTSDKKRAPAWCDRLLYRGVGKIKQVDYRRHEVYISDHRAVSGFFKIRVKTIDAKAQERTRDRCETEFAQVKERIALDIKLDYLVNVFGLSVQEAERLLRGRG